MSILCLYLRALNYNSVRVAARIILVIVVITHVWIIASLATVCIPISAFWDMEKAKTSYCHPFSVYWSHAGINILTDFMICALPLLVLHKLKVSRRQKVALYLVFLLAFGLVASPIFPFPFYYFLIPLGEDAKLLGGVVTGSALYPLYARFGL